MILLDTSDFYKQVRKELLQELHYMALKKQRARPNDLYFCDALCEVFNELYDNEVIASNDNKLCNKKEILGE